MPHDLHHGDAPPGETPDGGSGADRLKLDPEGLARDWITLWQSELAAMAVDREAQETWLTMMALWAGAKDIPTAVPPERPHGRDYEHAVGPSGTAAASAPDPRDTEIERLARQVHDLEGRLAVLEHTSRRRPSRPT